MVCEMPAMRSHSRSTWCLRSCGQRGEEGHEGGVGRRRAAARGGARRRTAACGGAWRRAAARDVAAARRAVRGAREGLGEVVELMRLSVDDDDVLALLLVLQESCIVLLAGLGLVAQVRDEVGRADRTVLHVEDALLGGARLDVALELG